jgi:hypothetical protein
LEVDKFEVDYREMKTGCLKRATNSWYEFINLLEAIYIINTNAGQALQHKGALFAKIAKAARRSLTLREKFKQCFPPHFGDKEKKSMFRIYSILILPSYGKMKSGDTLRLIRNSSPRESLNNIPLRAKVAVAHEKAKT